MKDLNKYNTALDLSKLSEEEMKYIENETKYKIGSTKKYPFIIFIWSYNQCDKSFIIYNKLNLVEFQTFKQIHFNAKTS